MDLIPTFSPNLDPDTDPSPGERNNVVSAVPVDGVNGLDKGCGCCYK